MARGLPAGWERHVYRTAEEPEAVVEREREDVVREDPEAQVSQGRKPGEPKRRSL